MPDLNEQVRAEFEAWWRTNMNTLEMDLHRFGDGYACHETNRGWMTWQAARQHGSAAQAVGQVINGIFWPEGYCTDPNGVIVAPAGRKPDFDFGYDIGYAEGLVAIKDSVKAIEERLCTAPPVADAAMHDTLVARLEEMRDGGYTADWTHIIATVSNALSRRPAAEQSAGQWVRCTPDLINAGVSCASTPRRDGDGTYSHDHFIAHAVPAAVPQTNRVPNFCAPDGTCNCAKFHDDPTNCERRLERTIERGWRPAMQDLLRVLRGVQAGDDSQWQFIDNVCANADDVLAAVPERSDKPQGVEAQKGKKP